MGPKITAGIKAIGYGVSEVLITDSEHLLEALDGNPEAGTRITKN